MDGTYLWGEVVVVVGEQDAPRAAVHVVERAEDVAMKLQPRPLAVLPNRSCGRMLMQHSLRSRLILRNTISIGVMDEEKRLDCFLDPRVVCVVVAEAEVALQCEWS